MFIIIMLIYEHYVHIIIFYVHYYVYIYPIAGYQQALSLPADSCFSSRWWLGSKELTMFDNVCIYMYVTLFYKA